MFQKRSFLEQEKPRHEIYQKRALNMFQNIVLFNLFC